MKTQLSIIKKYNYEITLAWKYEYSFRNDFAPLCMRMLSYQARGIYRHCLEMGQAKVLTLWDEVGRTDGMGALLCRYEGQVVYLPTCLPISFLLRETYLPTTMGWNPFKSSTLEWRLLRHLNCVPLLKFIYSEKATKFCKILTLLLTVCTVVKSKVKISQNFVAFLEYTNFTNKQSVTFTIQIGA